MRKNKIESKVNHQVLGNPISSDLEILYSHLKDINFNGEIIELGCGDGHFVNQLNECGYQAIGTDVSLIELEKAKLKYPKQNFYIEDAETLSFENDSIDAFYMINVIQYVDRSKALNEIYRTLKPNGFLLIHFNLSIVASDGTIQNQNNKEDILTSVNNFRVIYTREYYRIDFQPKHHTHNILELILTKK
jgi:ubiquinone/menaquinone biosynthesis C-methylase UbiE